MGALFLFDSAGKFELTKSIVVSIVLSSLFPYQVQRRPSIRIIHFACETCLNKT